MPSIETTRFGSVEVSEHMIVHFPNGLLGFPEEKNYIFLEHRPDSPFMWLQSLDRPDLAFVLTDPFWVKKDYLKDLSPAEKRLFQGESGGEVQVFVLVTIPRDRVREVTVNLLGPLVLEVDHRVGRQIVLPSTGYSTRYPIPTK